MTTANAPRAPQAFEPGDPRLVLEPEPDSTDDRSPPSPDDSSNSTSNLPAARGTPLTDRLSGAGTWGTILLSAVAGLVALSAGLWFAAFVSGVLQRKDWIGWLATALLAAAALATLAIIWREILGLLHLRSLRRLRAEAETVRTGARAATERRIIKKLVRLYTGRPDLAWPLARLQEHARDIFDPGDHLLLAERELMTPLDKLAQQRILLSARRVSVVTALSPTGLLSAIFVFYENVRLLRALATLYGGRPGIAGSLRLARMVLVHIVATGGLALTDDLLSQFIGQDLLRRLSRRLSEGVFNGAMTARVGIAAMTIVRPLPFVASPAPRLRTLVAALVTRKPDNTPP